MYQRKTIVMAQISEARIRSDYVKQNNPVNMEWVTSFYARGGGDDNDDYHQIWFEIIGSNQTIIKKWTYPASKDGESMREADLQFLLDNFCETAPKNILRAER